MIIFSPLLAATKSMGQPRTGLPLDLDYFMSRAEVVSHLKAFDAYRVESGREDTTAYVTPAPDTDTKNGLFLKFSEDKLMEIASTKIGMSKPMYDSYMSRLLSTAQQWKLQGIETIYEDQRHAYYLFKDNRSYISISGSAASGGNGKFNVTITFTERHILTESIHRERKSVWLHADGTWYTCVAGLFRGIAVCHSFGAVTDATPSPSGSYRRQASATFGVAVRTAQPGHRRQCGRQPPGQRFFASAPAISSVRC